jgi:peptidyl-prolyl cis-trans isomerase SurA
MIRRPDGTATRATLEQVVMKQRMFFPVPAKLPAALALCAGFLLAGCSWFGDDTPAPPAPESQTDAGPAPDLDGDLDDADQPEKTIDKDALRDNIILLVNDVPITVYDLDQRIGLIMITAGIPDTPEMRRKVREQALDQLETESIRRQAALKNDITVSSVEIDKRIKEILQDSHIGEDQLKELLGRANVSLASFRAQIANGLLWQKAVQMEYAGRVNVSADQVDAEMKRLAEGASKVHFAMAEIFLPVENPEQDEKIKKDAANLVEQIRAGAPFAAVARQFSQSPSAANGGSIGIVYDGQLAAELNQALEKMKTGDVSEPIRAIGGYYILGLQQRLEPYGTKVDAKVEQPAGTLPTTLPLARLLLPLGPSPSKALIENAMKIATNIARNVGNCGGMARVSKQIQGSVFMDLGSARMADLSAKIRDVMVKTEPGGVAEPFLSEAGVEIFARCDKSIPKLEAYQMPTREQIEGQLFDEQISALARRYDRDLRRDAHIEKRTSGA